MFHPLRKTHVGKQGLWADYFLRKRKYFVYTKNKKGCDIYAEIY